MILEKIKDHFESKTYCKISRAVDKDVIETSSGYIVDYGNDFLILQETDDFNVLGYDILPISQIKQIRFNKNDRYYHKIMVGEKQIEKVYLKYKMDLTSWQSIFKSIKSQNLNVIVECENPNIKSFDIGPIIKTTKTHVYIQYFDPCGFIDEKPTSIKLPDITKVKFDDRYINVFSKYLRKRK